MAVRNANLGNHDSELRRNSRSGNRDDLKEVVLSDDMTKNKTQNMFWKVERHSFPTSYYLLESEHKNLLIEGYLFSVFF